MSLTRVLATVLLAFLGTTSQAQPPELAPFAHGTTMAKYLTMTLLDIPAVQTELKLTTEQKARLKKADSGSDPTVDQAAAELRQRARELLDQGGDPQEVEALQKQARDIRMEDLKRTDSALRDVLDRRQRVRLDQIQLQLEGPMVFTRPDFLERLNIGPDTAEAIQAMIAEGRSEQQRASILPEKYQPIGKLRSPAERLELGKSKDYQAAVATTREGMLKVRSSTLNAILKLLTRKQRETYRKMLGEPFSLKEAQEKPNENPAESSKGTG